MSYLLIATYRLGLMGRLQVDRINSVSQPWKRSCEARGRLDHCYYRRSGDIDLDDLSIALCPSLALNSHPNPQ